MIIGFIPVYLIHIIYIKIQKFKQIIMSKDVEKPVASVRNDNRMAINI